MNDNYLMVAADFTTSHPGDHIQIAITYDDVDQQCHVWVMLNDPSVPLNPRIRGESFIVGSGDTAADALADAHAELARASREIARRLDTLQQHRAWYRRFIQWIRLTTGSR
jgi:hypothetical protein